MLPDRRGLLAGLLGGVALLASLAVCGCTGARPTYSDKVTEAVVPQAPNLMSPQEAVEAYTDWISYAYRVLDAQVATPTMTPDEQVRVDAYVEYNREKARAIEQTLLDADYTTLPSATATSALVVGSERWTYRYIAADASRYLTVPAQASYEVTYAVLSQPGDGWVVDRVEVAAAKTE